MALGKQSKPVKPKKRINFSTINGFAPAPRVFKLAESHNHVILEEESVSEHEPTVKDDPLLQTTELQLEQTFRIVSFYVEKHKRDLMTSQGCYFCADGGHKRCKLALINESTL